MTAGRCTRSRVERKPTIEDTENTKTRIRGVELAPEGVLLAGAVLALAALPLPFWERLPHICLNRHLFGFCVGCGSARALAALFHGQPALALGYNLNCVATAPLMLALLASSLRHRSL